MLLSSHGTPVELRDHREAIFTNQWLHSFMDILAISAPRIPFNRLVLSFYRKAGFPWWIYLDYSKFRDINDTSPLSWKANLASQLLFTVNLSGMSGTGVTWETQLWVSLLLEALLRQDDPPACWRHCPIGWGTRLKKEETCFSLPLLPDRR